MQNGENRKTAEVMIKVSLELMVVVL